MTDTLSIIDLVLAIEGAAIEREEAAVNVSHGGTKERAELEQHLNEVRAQFRVLIKQLAEWEEG